MALATWAEEFLRLGRRLSPSTLDTYRRDLRKYVLPRFGAYRLGRIPADEIDAVRVTSQLVRLESGEWLWKEPKTPSSIRSIVPAIRWSAPASGTTTSGSR